MLRRTINICAPPLAGRYFHGVHYAPSSARNSMAKYFLRNTSFPGKFCHRVFSALVCNNVVCSTIVALLKHCRPPAIAGEISFKIINSLDRIIFVRALAKVVIKTKQPTFPVLSIQPSIANCDAKRLVMRVCGVTRVCASTYHRPIRNSSQRALITAREAMRRTANLATARSRVAASQLISAYYGFCAAIADAPPSRSPSVIGTSAFFNSEHAAFNASHIDSSAHVVSNANQMKDTTSP